MSTKADASDAAQGVPTMCPVCGQVPSLPRISPERLWFLSGDGVRRFAVLPDNSVVVAVAGAAHVMTAAEWMHYKVLCRNAAATDAAQRVPTLEGVAA